MGDVPGGRPTYLCFPCPPLTMVRKSRSMDYRAGFYDSTHPAPDFGHAMLKYFSLEPGYVNLNKAHLAQSRARCSASATSSRTRWKRTRTATIASVSRRCLLIPANVLPTSRWSRHCNVLVLLPSTPTLSYLRHTLQLHQMRLSSSSPVSKTITLLFPTLSTTVPFSDLIILVFALSLTVTMTTLSSACCQCCHLFGFFG
ncbi:hypothetical protein BDZ89DRAFT_727492 [Hymenopellis radicata]|nr:hypothetical protein BDZ89DRAFT_727492 [Hymenopellis radicata]